MPVKKADPAEAEQQAPEVAKRLPVHTIPGKAVDVTEYGYDFENIHIRKDVPINVLAESFVERVGDGERPSRIKDAFFQAKSMINLYSNANKKQILRVRNGHVVYGAETFPIPGVGPEVLLRIIEDKWKTDRSIRSFFTGVNGVQHAIGTSAIRKTFEELGV